MNTGDSSLRRAGRVRRISAESQLFYHARAVRPEPLHIGGECPASDRLAQLREQREVIVQVVNSVEPRAEDLVRALQVMQVSAAEVAAGIAVAAFVERREVVAIARVTDLDVAVAREEPAVARVARGKDAVEHVDSVSDGFRDVLRRA